MRGRRFPRRVFDHGTEPDPRFSLANERTFLAWLRTALAMFAAAFALEAFEIPEPMGWRLAAAGVFLGLGMLATVHAWQSWAATERAMRLAAALPGSAIGVVLAVGVVIAAVLVAVGTLV